MRAALVAQAVLDLLRRQQYRKNRRLTRAWRPESSSLCGQRQTLRQAGIKPLILGAIVLVWLVAAGGALQVWLAG
jgi:membrane protein